MQGMGLGGALHAARRQENKVLKINAKNALNHQNSSSPKKQKSKDLQRNGGMLSSFEKDIMEDSLFDDLKEENLQSPLRSSRDKSSNQNPMPLSSRRQFDFIDLQNSQSIQQQETLKNDFENTLSKSRTQQLLLSGKQKVVVLKKSAIYNYHGKRKFYDKRSLFLFKGDSFIRKCVVWFVDWKLLELLPGSVKLKSLRVLRVLRPLRSINAIPSMKKHVSALIQSIPDFFNVAVFLLFIFMLFAILGVHQYQGVFYNACRIHSTPEYPTNWYRDTSVTRVCTQSGSGIFQCPNGEYCGNPLDYYLDPNIDQIDQNAVINYGITTFDHIGTSLITVFVIISTDGWSALMFNLMDTDIPFLAAFYCILMVVVGAFFLMNLILAVIIQAFIKIQKKELDEQLMNLEENLEGEMVDIPDKQPEQANFNDEDSQVNPNYNSQYKTEPMENPNQNTKFQDLDSRQEIMIGEKKNPFKQQQQKDKDDQQNSTFITIPNKIKSNPMQVAQSVDIGTALRQKKKVDQINTQSLEFHQETKQESAKTNNVDLSFLKPIAMKRKVIDIFSQSRDLGSKEQLTFENQLDNIQSENNNIMNGLKFQNDEQSQGESMQFQRQQSSKQTNIFFTKLFEQIAEKQIDDENTKQQPEKQRTESSDKFSKLFQNFLEKKKEEKKTQQEYFNDLLKESKQNYKNQMTGDHLPSLRQLASLRLGMKLRRQKDNLAKQYKEFRSEYRAEKNKIYRIAYQISQSKWFTGFISLAIVCNTVCLSLDKYPADEELSNVLEKINIGFSIIFILEMIIKLVALGFQNYFIDPFNTFDCIVVLASIIDLFISNLMSYESGGTFTALRAFRLLRVFKLAKSWKKLQHLLRTIAQTLKDVSTFSILLFLFMFTYSLLGMEMFAYKAKFDSAGNIDMDNGSDPPSNFNQFLDAFTTVFVILTNDGWSSIYFNFYRTVGSAVSTIFFISLIIIGQKILLNLFLAILLENFDEDSLNQEIKEQYKNKQQLGQTFKLTKIERAIKYVKDKIIQFFSLEDELTKTRKTKIATLESKNISGTPSIGNHTIGTGRIKFQGHNQATNATLPSPNRLTQTQNLSATSIQRKKLQRSKTVLGLDNNLYLEGKSLYLFGMENKFRIQAFDFVTHMRFDYFIIFIIIVSSVQLALENPLNDPNGKLINALYYIDITTTTIFSMEALLKIIAFGFVLNGVPSYLRNPWNMLDFVIVILSILTLTPVIDGFKIIKILRVVRPLRLISRNKGLKVAVKALALAIPSIANVTIITLLFFLIFGIIAISYFKGKLFLCNVDSIDVASQFSINTKWDCLNAGGSWVISPFSFDNIFDSIQTLFQMATTSGWSTIMYACISTTDIDSVMVNKNNPLWSLFFIFFIIVGSFFLLNLFVGVVISTFNREKDKIGGNNLLTDQQKEWIDTRLLVIQSKPEKKLRKPLSKIRGLAFAIQNHKYFDKFILICIILNTIVLTLKWYEQPKGLDQATDIINYIFTFIFTMEAVIKITALGKIYFNNGWNIFDFIVVIGSFASVFLTFFTNLQLGGATTIIRAFRITRVFRLIRRAQRLRLVFNTFIVTLPALANVGGLLLLLLYLYSVLGVFLFAEIKRNGVMNDVLNYESFFNAFVTLFVIATGDGWDQIMDSSTQQLSINFQCINYPSYQDYVDNGSKTIGCGQQTAALIYYYSYILLVNLIFLNLFIAIILQGFEDTQSKENRLFNNDTLAHFRKIWADFDPEATTFIPISQLKPFLFALGSPLGWDNSYNGSKQKQDRFIIGLELHTHNDFQDYQFLNVLDALSLRLMVQENFEKEQKKEHEDDIEQEQSVDEDTIQRKNTNQKEDEFKNQMIQGINKLKFQEDAQNIEAVQQVNLKERRLSKNLGKSKQADYFTSIHQAAAEVAFNHMKYVVAKRKLIRKIEDMEKDPNLEENNNSPDNHGSLKINIQALSKDPSQQSLNSQQQQSKQTSPIKAVLQKEPTSKVIIEDMIKSQKQIRKNTKNLIRLTTQKQQDQDSFDNLQKFSSNDNWLKVDKKQLDSQSSSFVSNLDTSQIDKIIDQETIYHKDQLMEVENRIEEFKSEIEDEANRTNIPSVRQQINPNYLLTQNTISQQFYRAEGNNQSRNQNKAQNQVSIYEGSVGGTGEQIYTTENYDEERDHVNMQHFSKFQSTNLVNEGILPKEDPRRLQSKKEISNLIQEELTRMLTIPKNQAILDRIEEAEDHQELERIKDDIVNNFEFMDEIEKMVENKIVTQSQRNSMKKLDKTEELKENSEEIDFDNQY